MISMSFWEAYVEGRNPWDKNKLGWKIKMGKFCLPAYHFYVFWIMWPLLLVLPLAIYGWDARLFGILLSAYLSGMVLEDFGWYLVNPAVKLREWFTDFSDYYPWIKIGGKKIVPAGYILGILGAILSWYFLWK
jgi:hypothetical protein